jgi:hypothetical protein
VRKFADLLAEELDFMPRWATLNGLELQLPMPAEAGTELLIHIHDGYADPAYEIKAHLALVIVSNWAVTSREFLTFRRLDHSIADHFMLYANDFIERYELNIRPLSDIREARSYIKPLIDFTTIDMFKELKDTYSWEAWSSDIKDQQSVSKKSNAIINKQHIQMLIDPEKNTSIDLFNLAGLCDGAIKLIESQQITYENTISSSKKMSDCSSLVIGYAKALEKEILTTVFKPFRDFIKGNYAELLEGNPVDRNGKILLKKKYKSSDFKKRLLLANYLADEGVLTLGQCVLILKFAFYYSHSDKEDEDPPLLAMLRKREKTDEDKNSNEIFYLFHKFLEQRSEIIFSYPIIMQMLNEYSSGHRRNISHEDSVTRAQAIEGRVEILSIFNFLSVARKHEKAVVELGFEGGEYGAFDRPGWSF